MRVWLVRTSCGARVASADVIQAIQQAEPQAPRSRSGCRPQRPVRHFSYTLTVKGSVELCSGEFERWHPFKTGNNGDVTQGCATLIGRNGERNLQPDISLNSIRPATFPCVFQSPAQRGSVYKVGHHNMSTLATLLPASFKFDIPFDHQFVSDSIDEFYRRWSRPAFWFWRVILIFLRTRGARCWFAGRPCSGHHPWARVADDAATRVSPSNGRRLFAIVLTIGHRVEDAIAFRRSSPQYQQGMSAMTSVEPRHGFAVRRSVTAITLVLILGFTERAFRPGLTGRSTAQFPRC